MHNFIKYDILIYEPKKQELPKDFECIAQAKN